MPNEFLIDSQINRYSDSLDGKKVSEQARKIIQDLFDAVLLDPHPSWRERKLGPEDVFNVYIQQIPVLLQNIVLDEKVEEIITTWDIMHWLGPKFRVLWPEYPEDPPGPNQPINPPNLPSLGLLGNDRASQDKLLGTVDDME